MLGYIYIYIYIYIYSVRSQFTPSRKCLLSCPVSIPNYYNDLIGLLGLLSHPRAKLPINTIIISSLNRFVRKRKDCLSNKPSSNRPELLYFGC